MNRWTLWFVSVLLILGVFAGVRSTAQDVSTVGYVDVDRLMNTFLQRDEVMGVLEAEKSRLEDALREELQSAESELTQEEQKAIRDRYQAQLDKKKDELIGQTVREISGLIEKVAKEEGVRLVLRREAVLYGGLDLTDRVLAAGGIVVPERADK